MATTLENLMAYDNTISPLTTVNSTTPYTDYQKSETNYTPGASQLDTPADMEAFTSQVNADNETVAGQMTGLLNSNSDYMKLAETKGLQQANSRGLLNSSMAVGAAQASAIEAALPIAQQDATAYFNTRMKNQDDENAARTLNTNFDNQVFLNDQNAYNTMQVDDNNFNNQISLNDQNAQNQRYLDELQLRSQEYIAEMDRNLKLQMEEMNLAAEDRASFSEAINEYGQQYMINYQEIMTDGALSETEQQRAIDRLNTAHEANMHLLSDIYGVQLSFENGVMTGAAGYDAAAWTAGMGTPTTTTPAVTTTPTTTTPTWNSQPTTTTQTATTLSPTQVLENLNATAPPVAASAGTWVMPSGVNTDPSLASYSPTNSKANTFVYSTKGYQTGVGYSASYLDGKINSSQYINNYTGDQTIPSKGGIAIVERNGKTATLRDATPADIGQIVTPPQTPAEITAWLQSPASKYWRYQHPAETMALGAVNVQKSDFSAFEEGILFGRKMTAYVAPEPNTYDGGS